MDTEVLPSDNDIPPDCLSCSNFPADHPNACGKLAPGPAESVTTASVTEDQASTASIDESSDAASGLRSEASSPCMDADFVHPTVFCKIPEGVEVRPNSYGHGIFVSKHFKAGEIIYTGQSVMVEDRLGKIPLKTSDGAEYMLDVQTHTVKQWDDNMRQLYAFDSFMNHSCDPTSESILLSKDSAEQVYHQVAVKDLAPGDEVTCDYSLFEYDCPDKAIYQCACGSEACLGTVLGFKYLTDAEKLQRLPRTDQCVIDAWLADNPDLMYFDLRNTTPDGVKVIKAGVTESGRPFFKMLAMRPFAVGELVFANESMLVEESKRLVVTIADVSLQLNTLDHTVNRGDGKREFYGFDSFMNHSCEPNTNMVYSTGTSYHASALAAIATGQEVTCDYETFDDCLDGSTFDCLCGTAGCRKIIKG